MRANHHICHIRVRGKNFERGKRKPINLTILRSDFIIIILLVKAVLLVSFTRVIFAACNFYWKVQYIMTNLFWNHCFPFSRISFVMNYVSAFLFNVSIRETLKTLTWSLTIRHQIYNVIVFCCHWSSYLHALYWHQIFSFLKICLAQIEQSSLNIGWSSSGLDLPGKTHFENEK